MTENNRLGFRPFLDGHHDASLNLQMHVYRRSEEQFARWERFRDGLKTPEQVRDWQATLREATLTALGGLPPGDTPLQAEHVGTLPGDGFEIRKVIFQSLPDVYVTANLYVPTGLAGQTGAVLFVCGYAEEAKAYPRYQAVCQRLARNGLVALAIDPVGQGERKSYLDPDGREQVRWGTMEHTYAGLQCWWLGQSVARYFVHDARRAIDYLVSLPEVDPARIGITGNSGGGTQATWLMLVEPRLAAAAPGTFVMARRDYMWTGQAQDAEQIIPGGTLHGIDHEDFLIAMAPRPVLALAVNYDFFNVEATVRTVERARRVYGLFDAADSIGLARADSTHEYHPDLASASTAFFVRHLGRGADAEIDDTEPPVLDARDLQCTRTGQILLDRPQTRRVFDLNVAERESGRVGEPRAGEGETPPQTDEGSRVTAAREWLAEAVQRHRRPGEFYPRWLPGPTTGELLVTHGYWWVETDLLGAGVLVRPASGEHESLLIALFDRGSTEVDERQEWLTERVGRGQAVLALDVRGSGALTPHQLNHSPVDGHYGTLYKLLTDLLWLDDSLAAGAVYDVLRAVELASTDREIGLRDRPIHLYGAGRGAFVGYLAAALEPRIATIELADTPVEPAEIVTTRLYEDPAPWQRLLPGFAARFTLADIRPLVKPRT